VLQLEKRDSGHRGAPREDATPASDDATAVERAIRCAQCGHALARERDRIEADGAHTHTFVNPSGEEYRIGCYRDASGCVGFGETESFWSWFPGRAWRVSLCGACAAHVGWSFHAGESVFWGLILDRVV
jgi:hypothetical protein